MEAVREAGGADGASRGVCSGEGRSSSALAFGASGRAAAEADEESAGSMCVRSAWSDRGEGSPQGMLGNSSRSVEADAECAMPDVAEVRAQHSHTAPQPPPPRPRRRI
eukprot:3952776-Prymnesium_polylepis.1